MHCLKQALQLILVKKQKKPKWKVEKEEEKQSMLKDLKKAKESDSDSSGDEVAALKASIKRTEKAIHDHKQHMMNIDNWAMERDIKRAGHKGHMAEVRRL